MFDTREVSLEERRCLDEWLKYVDDEMLQFNIAFHEGGIDK